MVFFCVSGSLPIIGSYVIHCIDETVCCTATETSIHSIGGPSFAIHIASDSWNT